MQVVAQSWLVLELTSSGAALGLVAAAQFLARTGLWPFTAAAAGFGTAIAAAALAPSLPGELAALTVAGFQHGVHGHRHHHLAAHRRPLGSAG